MPTILLIEDAAEMAQVIARQLNSLGFRVVQAADGVEGLEQFARCQPDLVILDWMLPRLDGLEVLRRLRQSSPVPVLMLTARGDEVDRVVGLEMGADDYLAKPFGMREMVARIRALLRRDERLRQVIAGDRQGGVDRLRWFNLELDPLAYQASLDGQALELTHTEFELLHLMVRNPGRTFTRRYLLETVWGGTYLEGDRSVDNAILRLRRKLGSLGEAIETVRSVGYRLKNR
jgi:DNA-binding response OmpR family regulator